MANAQLNQIKLVCDVLEIKGFPNGGILNPAVVLCFGGDRRKFRTRLGRVTSVRMSETFEFVFDMENTGPAELLVQVKEQKKGSILSKGLIGQVTIDLAHSEALGGFGNALGKPKEGWFTLQTKGESVCEVKLRLKLERGAPKKQQTSQRPTGSSGSNARRYVTKERRGNNHLPTIIQLVREKDDSIVEEFLANEPPEEIKAIVEKTGNSALHEACIDRSRKIIVMLLNNEHIDVNLKNKHDNTPLHYFCEKWDSPQFMDCFTLFLKRGANVNALNSNGESPIYKAITNGAIRTLLMEALIAHDADVNILSTTGEGLLHYAVRLQREDVLKTILQACPRLDLRGNKQGKTAYELAVEYNHPRIAEYLKQVEELFTWMDSADLVAHKSIFVKNEITMSLLPEINENSLGQMGIESVGARMKIMKAIKEKGPQSNSSSTSTPAGPPASNGGVLLGRKRDAIPEKQMDDLQTELTKMRQGGKQWIIENKDLEYIKHLGAGASGDVYRGLYQETHQVAIKVLKEMTADQEVEEFKKEFEILSTVHHQNVVFFYGAAFQPRLCMVMEYCSRGSLHTVMKELTTNELGWSKCIAMCKETCAGLNALHTAQILHRDLKSPNLLVTEQWHIKLADFGLSRFDSPENINTMKQMRGTFAYCDPEVYNGGIFTAASDIYSLSIIIWELVNRVIKKKYDQPYSEYKHLTFDFQIIIQAAKEDLRPTLPPNCPPIFKDLITRTWNKSQKARPSLDAISKCLDVAANDFATNPGQWNQLLQ